ncbi:MAG TPA: leucine-rich repeat domain-containing protein [Cytophagaceae bacterium]|nr:leucine-rich repeat domain-containing protein [Cytophagaceae bacterium]
MFAKILHIVCFLVLLQSKFCIAQTTVPVPDANFRSFLQTNFSSVMSGNLLDTVAASNVTGTLNCHSRSISDITGIQYFKKLTIINLSNNSISTLPALKNFSNLQQLYCDTNQLTSVPALNALTTLQVISFKKNNLTALPSLTGLTNLTMLRVGMNNLSALPSLSGLTSMTTLDASENNLTQLPDLSSLINLENLYCGKNALTVLPSLQTLVKLQILICGENQLTSIPELHYCTLLKFIRISDNQISQLPDLSFMNTPTQVHLDHNNLSFEDLLAVVSNSNYSSTVFELFPQNILGNYADTIVKKNGQFRFKLNIDESVNSNTYEWYRKNTYISSTSSDLMQINGVADSDTGSYYAVIKNSNPAFVGDSLVSNMKKMKVAECFVSATISITAENISCKEGFRVTVNTSNLTGVISPLTYSATNTYTGESYASSMPVISRLPEGNYQLQVQDAMSCETTPFTFDLVSGSDCDPVFSPNGDGIADTYYISTPGRAKIFNKNGTLIQEFTTPAYWDGVDKNGAEAPSGYYAIIVNEKITMHISLMR